MWNFKKLEVWQRTRRLIIDVYECSKSFPMNESFGLTAQMRRAANSIGANIAEGCAREGRRDRARFFETSNASAHELEHHLILSADVGFLESARADRLIAELEEIRKMLGALRLRTLRESDV